MEKIKEIYHRIKRFGEWSAVLVMTVMSTWVYVLTFLFFTGFYMHLNNVSKEPWDPYPYILLNLGLSLLAAIQGSLIMMAPKVISRAEEARRKIEHEKDLRQQAKEDEDRRTFFVLMEGVSVILHRMEERELENER